MSSSSSHLPTGRVGSSNQSHGSTWEIGRPFNQTGLGRNYLHTTDPNKFGDIDSIAKDKFSSSSSGSSVRLNIQQVSSGSENTAFTTDFEARGGRLIASEMCQTENTQEMFVQGCTDHIEHLEKLIVAFEHTIINYRKILPDDGSPLQTTEAADLDSLVASCQKLKAKRRNLLIWKGAAERADSTWIKSSSYREKIAEHGTVDAVAQNYAPRPVNRRTQQVFNNNGDLVSSVGRCGATTDFSNGQTSLKQMKKLQANIQSLSAFGELSPGQTNQLKIIFRNNPKGMELLTSGTPNLQEIKQILSEMIDKRQLNLEYQIVQDLSAHLESMPQKNLQKIIDGERPPLLVRLSLLDFVKKPGSFFDNLKAKKNTQDAEWIPHEKHEIEDMQEIFDSIHGKEVIFGEKGPFIDGDKIYIRLNRKDVKGLEEYKPQKLQAAIFNVSVTKNVENIQAQRELNEKAFGILEEYFKNVDGTLDGREKFVLGEMKRLKALLAGSGKLHFNNAANLGSLLVSLNSMLTVNCLSGKDRTGLILAMLTQKQLVDLYDHEHKGIKKKEEMEARDRQLADWGEQLLNNDSIIMKVIRENTNFDGVPLKLGPNDSCSTVLARSRACDKFKLTMTMMRDVVRSFC